MTDETPEEQTPEIKALYQRLEDLKSRSQGDSDIQTIRSRFREITDIVRDARKLDPSSERETSRALEIFEEVERFLDFGWVKKLIYDKFIELLPTKITPEVIQDVHRKLKDATEAFQREWIHTVRFALADDAYGVIIRGHIIIENALEACIEAYLPQRPKLSQKIVRKYRSGYPHKVATAYRLGILDDAECEILSCFNELRDTIAHRFGGVDSRSKKFEFDWKDERRLWGQFSHNSAMLGRWPEYDEKRFPYFLQLVVLHLYLHLQRKVDALLKIRLPAQAVASSPTEDDVAARTAVTMIMFEFVSKVGDFRQSSEGESLNDSPSS